MKSGRIIATGNPNDIVNETLIENVFGLRSVIIKDPISGTPMVVPKGRY
jgi:ABC-type cobalamin/Fe3+-siderophores transport systems, ATPase components